MKTKPAKLVSKKRFTRQEDAIIVDFIKNKQYKNLQGAFRKLSVIMNRKRASINTRYYRNLRHSYDMFQLVSGNTVLVNTKFVHEGKEADFKPFQYIVKQIMDLPKEDRDKVFAFFK